MNNDCVCHGLFLGVTIYCAFLKYPPKLRMLTKFKLIRRRTGEGRKEIAGYDLVIVKARYQGRDSLYLYVCLKIFHSKTIFISVKINHFSISHVHSLIFNPPTTSISNSFSVSLPWIHCNKAKFYLCRM